MDRERSGAHENVAAAQRRTRRMFRRNAIITLTLVLIALAFTVARGPGMRLELGKEALTVTSPDQRVTKIRYEDILALSVCEGAQYGTCLEGKKAPDCWYGEWDNERWGRYYLCVHPRAKTCLAFETGGGFVVINAASDQETRQLAQVIEAQMT